MEIELVQSTSLEKVMPYHKEFTPIEKISALKGERVSWQISLKASELAMLEFEIKNDMGTSTQIRRVGYVPAEMPSYDHDHDDDVISHDAGMYPDILYPMDKCFLSIKVREYTTIMITVDIPDDIAPGDYEVTAVFACREKKVGCESAMRIHIIDACLPEQKMKYTQWMHTDCIADYYNMKIFSEEHWQMIEKFIKTAVNSGVNMIFTPLFTPPLDTRFGSSRPTVQLVDVYKKKNKYLFEYDKLERWMEICGKYGVNTFEFSHMLTQWGAKFAPKIMVNTIDGCVRMFGWETDSDSPEYEDFLRQFYASFDKFLKWHKGEYYIHVADEPDVKNIEYYMHGYKIIHECMKNYKIMDAVSEVEVYKKGITRCPVPNLTAADDIFALGVDERWVYYSCANSKDVCNRYIAMPSYRNRGIGWQFYKYKLDGFLHWGYNFYNSGLSDYHINPFSVTDACGLMPAGDSFSVYPGSTGPIESIRMVVFYEALQDLRACELLEKLAGRDTVLEILEKDGEITFKKYPRSIEKSISLREEINAEIEKYIEK